MKIKKFEQCNKDMLAESFFGVSKLSSLIKIINKLTYTNNQFSRDILSNPSSTKNSPHIKEYIEELNEQFGEEFMKQFSNDYVFHHIDGVHSDDSRKNVLYISNRLHNKINNMAVKKVYDYIR